MTDESARIRATATDYVLQRYHLSDLAEAQQKLSPAQFAGVLHEIDEVQAQISAQLAQPRPRDDVPGISTPIGRVLPMTALLLAINIVMFIVESMQPASAYGTGGSQDIGVLDTLGAIGPGMFAMGEYWRLVAACFLHIGVLHIASNGLALFWLGSLAERFYGPLRFLGIYLAAGVAGNAVAAWLQPAIGAGASGAIFGLLGAMLVASWRNRAVLGAAVSNRIFRSLGQLLLINIAISFLPGISLWAHFGGAVTGAVLALAIPFPSPHYSRRYNTAANVLSIILIVATLSLLLTLIGHHEPLPLTG